MDARTMGGMSICLSGMILGRWSWGMASREGMGGGVGGGR